VPGAVAKQPVSERPYPASIGGHKPIIESTLISKSAAVAGICLRCTYVRTLNRGYPLGAG
jgi:hypothetical protein